MKDPQNQTTAINPEKDIYSQQKDNAPQNKEDKWKEVLQKIDF